MCLPERLAILICFDANAHVLFTGEKKLVVPFHRLRTYLPKATRVGIFELLVSQNERVVRREWQVPFYIFKNTTHVFARRGGKFELL